jgi:glycosyltransferase involved in cell wall biosynthesis
MNKKVGLFFGSFTGGGAERMMINLAKGLNNKGVDVIIYVVNKTGPYLKEVPETIPIYSFEATHGVKSIIYKIRKSLKCDGLDAFISTQMHINSAVGLASIGLKKRPMLIFREANTPSKSVNSKILAFLYRLFYAFADHYVAVSRGVKDDMVQCFNLNQSNITVIYNPVIDDTIFEKMKDVVEHPWFNDSNVPVVVGMGNFVPQKAFEDLIDAFSIVRKKMKLRLVIFGKKNENTEYYKSIVRKIESSKYSDDILLPGFVENPFKYLHKCNLFVLSSKYEGLPGVLIQALACGCSVISTDCLSGPKEILDNGKYGVLVPVGNVENLAKAIGENLEKVEERQSDGVMLERFSMYASTENYLNIIQSK